MSLLHDEEQRQQDKGHCLLVATMYWLQNNSATSADLSSDESSRFRKCFIARTHAQPYPLAFTTDNARSSSIL